MTTNYLSKFESHISDDKNNLYAIMSDFHFSHEILPYLYSVWGKKYYFPQVRDNESNVMYFILQLIHDFIKLG